MNKASRALLVASILVATGCHTIDAPPWMVNADLNERRILKAMKEAVGTYGYVEGPLTIQEIENHPRDMFKSIDPGARSWIDFKEKKKDGFEIYYMETSEGSWESLMGVAGYFIVDGARGIDFYETIRN